LWYDFTSIKNNTVYDQSRYGNHGTVYGATPVGRFGLHGTHYDGVDDYMRANNVVTDKIFTIIIFFEKVLPFSSGETLFDTRDDWFGSGGKGIAISRYSDTEQYWVGIGDGTNKSWGGNFTVIDGKKFVVLRSDGNNLDVIVNQQLINSRDISSLGSIYANDKMYFASNFGGDSNAKVNIYFSAFYNRALSDAEIRELYYYLTKGIRSIIPSRFVARATG